MESLADSDAEADSVIDSVAESLVAAVLPGLRTALPSVAKVFTCAAVMSYSTGGVSDTIYGPSSPPTVISRIRETTVDLQPPGT